MQTRANQPDPARILTLYRTMSRIRSFEEAAEAAQREGLVTGALHLSIGQEAVATGICSNLRKTDFLTSNHRGHGHTLAKGADPVAMMRELFGRTGGTCGGKGGSMHIADFSIGMIGANGIVADGIPIAAGAAHGAKIRGEDSIAVCFFGDGAVNRGPFLEGLNWARIFDLPVLFVCEDNGFASTTRSRAVTAGSGPAARAEAIGLEAYTIDGNDIALVDDLAGELVGKIRAGRGPMFVAARTYRLRGHTTADAGAYRPADEVAQAEQVEPMARARELLAELDVEPAEPDRIDQAAAAEMAAAVALARDTDYPAAAEAFADVQDIGAVSWSS